MRIVLTVALALGLGSFLGFVPAVHALTNPQLSAGAAQTAPAKLDLNTASREELVAVPGVGAATADAIVDLRAKRGAFSRVEDLLQIRGIKAKRLKALSKYLSVLPPVSSSPAPGRP